MSKVDLDRPRITADRLEMTSARKMDTEWSRPGGRSEKGKKMRIRLKVKESGMTRDKVIETVFLKTEVPFIRIFCDFPN